MPPFCTTFDHVTLFLNAMSELKDIMPGKILGANRAFGIHPAIDLYRPWDYAPGCYDPVAGPLVVASRSC